jgi:hypothetical protein
MKIMAMKLPLFILASNLNAPLFVPTTYLASEDFSS